MHRGGEEAPPWYFREDIASAYETWYEGKYRKADVQEKAVLREGIDWIGDVRTIFEVGCGTAHFMRYFEEIGIDSCGADLSPLMLREAMKLGRGGEKLIRATAASLPVREKVFDVVAFVTCLEYMPEPVNIISEASRVARKGILLGLINSWSVPTLRRKIQLLFGRSSFYRTAHFFSLAEITDITHEAIGKENCEIFQRSTVFPRAFPVKESGRLPFGAFLCVSIRFKDGPV